MMPGDKVYMVVNDAVFHGVATGLRTVKWNNGNEVEIVRGNLQEGPPGTWELTYPEGVGVE